MYDSDFIVQILLFYFLHFYFIVITHRTGMYIWLHWYHHLVAWGSLSRLHIPTFFLWLGQPLGKDRPLYTLPMILMCQVVGPYRASTLLRLSKWSVTEKKFFSTVNSSIDPIKMWLGDDHVGTIIVNGCSSFHDAACIGNITKVIHALSRRTFSLWTAGFV